METKNAVAPSWIHLTDPSTPAFKRDWYELNDKDSGVATVQRTLVHHGYLRASDVTGVYDQVTMTAVAKFQADKQLKPDGKAGIGTMQAMLAYQNHGF